MIIAFKLKLDETDYYKDLSHLQNHAKCVNVDIITITAFQNERQKIDHALRYAELTKDTALIEKYS